MQNTFNNVLRSLRLERGITQKQLSNGLCSVSTLCLIENGERLPDHSLRIRLIKRLGLHTAKLINFLQPRDYELWQKQMDIIYLVKNNKVEDAVLCIDELEERLKCSDIILKQFVCDMRGFMYIRQNQVILAQEEYQKAVDYTMKGINVNNLSDYALSPIEYYYLIMWIDCMEKSQSSDLLSIHSFYQEIIRSIEDSSMNIEIKAEIYPLVALKYVHFLERNPQLNNIIGLNVVTKAIEILRNSSRIYYLMELLVTMKKYIDLYDLHNLYAEDYADIMGWIHSLNDLYEITCVTEEDYSFFMYSDDNNIPISTVIRSRRELLGWTQDQLADGICSVKTLRRIEQGIVGSQQFVLELLFQKLGLNYDFHFEEVVSDEWKILRMAQELRKAMNALDVKNEKTLIDSIKNSIDIDIPQNQQMLLRSEAVLMLQNKDISFEAYIDMIEQALSITIQPDIYETYQQGYLTEGELQCLYSIAYGIEQGAIKSEKEKILLDKIIRVFEYTYEQNIPMRPAFQSLILRLVDSVYAEKEEYLLSNKYALLSIAAEVSSYKINNAIFALYDLTWNDAKMADNPLAKKFENNIEDCYYLANLFKDKSSAAFFQSRMKLIKAEDKSWVA